MFGRYHGVMTAGTYALMLYMVVVMGGLVGASAAYDADTAAEATVALNESDYVTAAELNESAHERDEPAVVQTAQQELRKLNPMPESWRHSFNEQFRVGVAGFVNGHLRLAEWTANTTAGVVYPIHDTVPKWLLAGVFEAAGWAGMIAYGIGIAVSVGEVFY
jgi:hypothetical protein